MRIEIKSVKHDGLPEGFSEKRRCCFFFGDHVYSGWPVSHQFLEDDTVVDEVLWMRSDDPERHDTYSDIEYWFLIPDTFPEELMLASMGMSLNEEETQDRLTSYEKATLRKATLEMALDRTPPNESAPSVAKLANLYYAYVVGGSTIKE